MSNFEEENVITEEKTIFSEEEAVSFSEDSEDRESVEEKENIIKRAFNKFKSNKKLMIISAVVVGIILLLVIIFSIKGVIDKKKAEKNMYTDVEAQVRTISNVITGSSYVEPNASYNVTTIKSGDITADYFKEGDKVKKGDKLYQFDDEDAKNSLNSAKNSVTKAEQSYLDAVKTKTNTVKTNDMSMTSIKNSLQKAQTALDNARKTANGRYPSSDIDGKIKEVFVSEGDNINTGTNLVTIYNDTNMKIRLPFNEHDAESVYVGADAVVSVVGSGEELYGTVTQKSSSAMASDAHTMVVYATIELTNPGALTSSDIGSAEVNGVACANTANFEYIEEMTITSEVSGTLRSLDVALGDGVYAGQSIGYIESDSTVTSLENAEIAYQEALMALDKQILSNDTFSQDSNINNAKLSLEDAKLNLEKAQETVDDYLIEAPIDGTVVRKNAKSGETIDSSNSTDPLCIIYDLSCVKFSIEVDETEIALVKTGQEVNVTADAVEGQFTGEVTKVPVDGVNSNGITTYTIEVEIEEYGDLLPGMNIDAEITVEEAEEVVTIPVNAVNRGDIVFIKDDGEEHENDVTELIKNRQKDQMPEGEKSLGNAESPKGTPDAGRIPDGNMQSPQESMPPENEDMGKLPKRSETPSPEVGGNVTRTTVPPAEAEKIDNKPDVDIDINSIPMNIEIPDGYLAIKVETGINDTEYIEIKSGINEGDLVRTINTESSSAAASFGMSGEMGGMRGGMGGMSGGMGGGMPGGMGGGMSGGMRGGMGGR